MYVQRLPTNSIWILLSRRRRLFGSVDHQLFTEMCFVVIESLERAKRMSWYKMSRSITVAIQKERKRRIVAHRDYKLLLGKDWFEIVRVNCGIASISPLRIDIPLSSESIHFGAKITRIEPDNKVELKEVLRPLYLSLG